MRSAASNNSTDMLKTVCTVVTFLVIFQFSLECAQAFTLPRRTRNTSEDNGPAPWMDPCGDKTQPLNNTSILKGKEQKYKIHKTLNTYIKKYRIDLREINKSLDSLLNLSHFGEAQPNNLTIVFNNRSHKAIHRRLQIYIAIFDDLYHKVNNKRELTPIQAMAANRLQELRNNTQHLLCFMEDMLNGTDAVRMKPVLRPVMKKIVRKFSPSNLLEKSIILALESMDNFMGEFEHFVEKRLTRLKEQKSRRNGRNSTKRDCLRNHICKNGKRKLKKPTRRPRGRGRLQKHKHHAHMRTTPQ